MPISPERILADVKAIAAFTQTPGDGATRPIASEPWQQARDYAIAQLSAIGCNVRTDEDGSVRARPAAIAWEAPAWLSGSQLYTASRAGDYDGVIGVVLPLEALRAAREDLKVALPMELAIWSDAAPSAGKSTIGYVELRVEPGPNLWNDGAPIGVVNRIAGHREYRCSLAGAGGSASAVPTSERRDALVAAADLIGTIDRLAHEMSASTCITVTRIEPQPNTRGMICASADLWIDVSSGATDALARADAAIHHAVTALADARGIEAQIAVLDSQSATDLDANVCAKLARVAKAHLNGEPMRQLSAGGGSLVAAVLAKKVPSSAIFIASRDGIHQHRDEFCRPADLAIAAKVLFDTVRDRRLE